MARGYLGRPELTAERFIPDPRSAIAGGRLYRTGDRARYRPEGELDFLGRLDHQVKVRGFRIELGEIETALLGRPGVRDAVVVAREDVPGDRRLVAYVVGEVPVPELRRALGERLPEYMVPSTFVFLEALPQTPNGKVDRKALPKPEGAAGEGYAAPRTPVEELLAGIWSSVLGVERVGREDHFFERGGHSLLAMQVVSRVREVFGVELPVRRLFEAPTLGALAERIAAEEPARVAQPPLVPRGFTERGAAVLRAGAALVPRPTRAGRRGLQHPGSPAAGGRAGRGGTGAGAGGDRLPPRGAAHGVPADRGPAGRRAARPCAGPRADRPLLRKRGVAPGAGGRGETVRPRRRARSRASACCGCRSGSTCCW